MVFVDQGAEPGEGCIWSYTPEGDLNWVIYEVGNYMWGGVVRGPNHILYVATAKWDEGLPGENMLLAIEAQGHAINTIEGLAKNGRLHPLQEAFIKHDAMQCGFCTPGMVMVLKGLLDRNPNPSLADVKTAISGNLCKCGTYPKIFRAVLDAAQLLRGAAGAER